MCPRCWKQGNMQVSSNQSRPVWTGGHFHWILMPTIIRIIMQIAFSHAIKHFILSLTVTRTTQQNCRELVWFQFGPSLVIQSNPFVEFILLQSSPISLLLPTDKPSHLLGTAWMDLERFQFVGTQAAVVVFVRPGNMQVPLSAISLLIWLVYRPFHLHTTTNFQPPFPRALNYN